MMRKRLPRCGCAAAVPCNTGSRSGERGERGQSTVMRLGASSVGKLNFVSARVERPMRRMCGRMPVVVVTSTEDAPVDMAVIHSRLRDMARVRVVPLPNRRLSRAVEAPFCRRMRDAAIIFQRPGFITRRIIESCPELKYVLTHGAGVDKIDLEACRDHKIWVGNIPGGNANAVAEYVIAGILALLRGLPQANSVMKQGGWVEGRYLGGELSGSVLGIVGFGSVGRRLAEIVKGFGTRVVVYDPYRDPNADIGGTEVEFCRTLDELLTKSDHVSLHVPLTPETTGLIGLEELRKLKRGAILVNSSRGGIVDERALANALKTGQIAGAVCDVFAQEPLPKNSPLRGLTNAVFTPHIGGSTRESLRRIAERSCEEMRRVLLGRRPAHLVELSEGTLQLASRA